MRNQRGYMMMALLFAVALLALAAVAIAPRIAQQIQRDREEELIRRGRQYAVAIRKFYKKFGRYPARIEELENTNQIRFLRRRYKDPMVKDGEFRLIRFGESQLLRQPVQQPGFTGVGPQPQPGGIGTSPQPPPAGSAPGTPASNISRPIGGQPMGGGPIVGVASTSEKESIKVLDKKNHYNEWEFVYDPRLDPAMQQGGAGQVPPGQRPPGQQPPGRPGPPPGTRAPR